MQTPKYAFGVRSELIKSKWYHYITRENLETRKVDQVSCLFDHDEIEEIFIQAKRWEENQCVPGYFFPEEDGPQSYEQYLMTLSDLK